MIAMQKMKWKREKPGEYVSGDWKIEKLSWGGWQVYYRGVNVGSRDGRRDTLREAKLVPLDQTFRHN